MEEVQETHYPIDFQLETDADLQEQKLVLLKKYLV